ncbi:MAG: nicotinamide-nucleotide adenylyltransferase [Thermoprotei archaeon]|nr:MAG: nicotinamide-nucleotide adenylyltransferase [Thermoprotei archaeon]
MYSDRVRGVYPGRFQPMHKGHLQVIRWALQNVDELIIVIGTAQESHTIANPFTAGERMVMIREALRESGIDLSRVYIVPVPDILLNAVWVHYLRLYVPSFRYGIARNPLVVRLFKEAGYEVLVPPPYDRERYSSTRIRRLMIQGDDTWRELVPPAVARVIDEIGGVERLREVTGRD